MTIKPPVVIPELFFETQNAWREWLAVHFEEQSGVWLRFAKKGGGVISVTYAEALDVALCYGWIDGQAKPLDAGFYLQRFTPRRARSIWSKRNIGKVAELIDAGRMQPPGAAAVQAAKADGRWEQAYDSPRTMTVPEDFQAALNADPAAKAFFALLNKTNSYAILWRIQTAKKPETRRSRIETFIGMLREGRKIHP